MLATLEQYSQTKEQLPCLKISIIDMFLLSKRQNYDIDLIIKTMKDHDTITVAIENRSVRVCEVRFFSDAAIARFLELQNRLCRNSNVVKISDFEADASKIQFSHHSQLTDVERERCSRSVAGRPREKCI